MHLKIDKKLNFLIYSLIILFLTSINNYNFYNKKIFNIDIVEVTGFSFKLADEVPMDFKGGGFGDDDTDPEIINIAGNKIAVIKYNL